MEMFWNLTENVFFFHLNGNDLELKWEYFEILMKMCWDLYENNFV